MTPNSQPRAPEPASRDGEGTGRPGDPFDGAPRRHDSFAELRHILLAPEQGRIGELEDRLNEDGRRTAELAGILPAVVVRSRESGNRLRTALEPLVEGALQDSVRRDPHRLGDALFPVMGPAIRRAALHAVRSFAESLNSVLEQSLTWHGLQWRLESIRTGKPIGDIALAHCLVFQVRQVLLIHAQTGLVLQTVSLADVAEDEDLVSAMLTAIQDFVRQSFTEPPGDLEAIEVGDHRIYIERGPQALLAAVVRGNAPSELRSILQDTLSRIHIEMHRELTSFQGDTATFQLIRPQLEDCLRDQRVERKNPPLLRIASVVLVALLGSWGWFAYREHSRWQRFLDLANAEPGIVVLSTGNSGSARTAFLLRDPLSSDPADLLRRASVDLEEGGFQTEPFLSFNPKMMVLRAAERLRSPASVEFRFDNGVLFASGAAPHLWIQQVRAEAPRLPGVQRYDDSGLTDADFTALMEHQRRIEGRVVRFPLDSPQPIEGEAADFPDLADRMKELISGAGSLGLLTSIRVVGHADSSGSERRNLLLSRRRAEEVRDRLLALGVPGDAVEAVGMGSKRPAQEEASEDDHSLNRRVSFKISLLDRAEASGEPR